MNTLMIRKVEQPYCWFEASCSSLDRSNQPQSSLKTRPNPQQGLNSLQFYRGWVSCRRKVWIEASRGWFTWGLRKQSSPWKEKYKLKHQRCWYRSYKCYSDDLAEIINEGIYIKEQIFSVDKTAFYWKKIPPSTFRSRKKKNAWL